MNCLCWPSGWRWWRGNLIGIRWWLRVSYQAHQNWLCNIGKVCISYIIDVVQIVANHNQPQHSHIQMRWAAIQVNTLFLKADRMKLVHIWFWRKVSHVWASKELNIVPFVFWQPFDSVADTNIRHLNAKGIKLGKLNLKDFSHSLVSHHCGSQHGG